MTTPKDGVDTSDSATTSPAANIERMVAVLREARSALESARQHDTSECCDAISCIDAVLPKGTK